MTNSQMQNLGFSANGITILLDRSNTNIDYHLLETPNLLELVSEALPQLLVSNENQVVLEHDFKRVVGTTNLVETTAEDEIVYAKRIGRDAYSRFAKNRQPIPCSSIVVVLRKGELGYYLWTAMCAKLLPKEAWTDSSDFNNTHAMAYDEKLIQLDTVTNLKTT